MRTIQLPQNTVRAKWRGKTMCFKPEPRLIVGETIRFAIRSNGELAPVTAEELASSENAETYFVRFRGESALPSRARVFYCYQSANDKGVNGHAQEVMHELGEKRGFRVLNSQAESLYDGWVFWIEYGRKPVLPAYVRWGTWKDAPEA